MSQLQVYKLDASGEYKLQSQIDPSIAAVTAEFSSLLKERENKTGFLCGEYEKELNGEKFKI